MWVVPVVSQTTSSVFSMEWLSWVNCPRPESLSERFGYLPSGYFSSGLYCVTHSCLSMKLRRW
ncbi:hypothetical protein D3C81_1143630 [compost metagenome]